MSTCEKSGEKNQLAIREKIEFHFHLEHWQVVMLFLLAYDACTVAVSYFAALWIRFDCAFQAIPLEYLNAYYGFIPFDMLFTLAIFWLLRLYKSIWRFASYDELLRVTIATGITLVFHILGITIFIRNMPISYFLFGIIIQFILTLGIRFAYRFIILLRGRRINEEEAYRKRVMIIGAGEAGKMILRDIKGSRILSEQVCCMIDDDSNKWGRYMEGVLIVGGSDCIMESVQRHGIQKIYVALPSVSMESQRKILNICKETGCELKNLPGLYQFMTGQVSVASMKEVEVEDLLGRAPIRVNVDEIFQYIKGKTVLITGGGGSIGSGLARQVAEHEPKKLIIFDVYENNAYAIQLELRKKYPDLDLAVLIGSVRDSRKIFQVFERYHPDIVYHAAAHKHVPLMEESPCEAIKNNAIGTYKTAYAAMANNCSKFVLISTDKAVNPTNIMGASKRLCEMIIQSFDAKIKEGKAEEIPQLFTHLLKDGDTRKYVHKQLGAAKTEFVAVRFGNVLDSNGSVIPLFKKQIQSGGPVTVTHPEIIRYFMTIPEAVSLVMQAGTYAHGGEIFVLDMGEPVKIDTLARNLIKLSGHKPDVDIQITYIGLRPGEKLYEEKLMAEEGLERTENDLIHIGHPVSFDVDGFLRELDRLMEMVYENKEEVREMVKEMVGTYQPVGENTPPIGADLLKRS